MIQLRNQTIKGSDHGVDILATEIETAGSGHFFHISNDGARQNRAFNLM
jgi:hypothetical protein